MTSFKLRKLATLIEGWKETSFVRKTAKDISAELSVKVPFAGTALPQDFVHDRLPPEIKSAWVFVIRPRGVAPSHLHPNSVQHMAVIGGTGNATVAGKTFQLRPFDPAFPFETIYVIDQNVSHSVEAGNESLVLLSFHNVLPDELIEIEAETGEERKYT